MENLLFSCKDEEPSEPSEPSERRGHPPGKQIWQSPSVREPGFASTCSPPANKNHQPTLLGNNLTNDQKLYTYWHSRTHRIIEYSFGIMAARFWGLGHPIESFPSKAVHIVKACVALHNFLIATDAMSGQAARYMTPDLPDTITAAGEVQPGQWRRMAEADSNLVAPGRQSGVQATHAATATRNCLRDVFQTPKGCFPWQHNVVRRGLND
ncbi:hypothetical protein AAFF_G00411240 [Aldrovandia affinis]|uniref:DDE Tnp4 domain-containing protein n=1 Tax=Aldrovandia affinis TaxID=143900 RepID=A0AAD7SBR7_9TELE|nr:hypothetical protein AAFF_G00411240 [Aldrovandia affinis]